MCVEIAVSLHADTITAEVDAEKEHEENKEKEKEKTTEIFEDLAFHILFVPSALKGSHNENVFWNSPSLDFYTPPPELI